MRRQVYSDEVVGERNLQMAALARAHGFAAKFTGSGGACVCLRRPKAGGAPPAAAGAPSPVSAGGGGPHPLELSVEEEQELRAEFAKLGFSFVRVQIDADGSAGGEGALASPQGAAPKGKGREVRGAVLQID